MSGLLAVGLVGCGRLAEHGYVPAFRRASGLRLVAVADPVRERCESVAPGLPSFGGCAALLAGSAVDAVVLATSAVAHLGDARLVAAAGLPALVEKPPAPDRAGAAALAALDPAPCVGFNRRFEPGLMRLRSALRGEEGVELRLDLHYRRRSWRPHAVDDEVLLDLGPHAVDLASWLVGSPAQRVRVAAAGRERVELELELGPGRARISLATNRRHRERLLVRDRAGRMLFERAPAGVVSALLGRLRSAHPLVDSLTLQLEAFARAVHGAEEPALGSAAAAVGVMAAVDAARDAAREPGTWRAVEAGDPAVPAC